MILSKTILLEKGYILKQHRKDGGGIIQPHGYIRANKANKAHIHNRILRECGVESGQAIPYILSANVVLLYDPSCEDKLLASIDVLKEHISLKLKR